MNKKPVVNQKSCLTWRNWHKSITVGGTVSTILQPTNQYETGNPPKGREFMAGLQGLHSIIQKARRKKKRVRAFGSRWSLNNIAFTNEYLVDSDQLDYVKVGLAEDQLTEKYKSKSKLLVFAQCGLMVRSLNEHLQAHKLSLPTSGASDGQRIVGAIATGTHGSAHAVGAMTEYVKGIHAVVLDKHVYIQRASDQVINKMFAAWLNGAEIVNDDDLFNAALVGFGGFGLTHALVLEVEPQYCLERVIRNYDVSQVRKAITEWDLSGLNLPYGDKMPFHFECVINPYHIADGEKGAYVRVYYRHPSNDECTDPSIPYSDTPNLHESMGKITKEILKLVRQEIEDLKLSADESAKAKLMGALVDIALKIAFPTATPPHPTRVPSKWFTGKHSADPKTDAPIAGTSIELGVPFDRVKDALNLVVDTLQKHPFAAPLAFRYVKKSSATLGFTGVGDITATMEMPGPWGNIFFPDTGKAHEALFKALGASDLPHSFHWGQQFPKDHQWVERTYGKKAVAQWKAERLKLLGVEGINMFSNKPMSQIGLAEQQPYGKPGFFCRLLSWIRYLFGIEG